MKFFKFSAVCIVGLAMAMTLYLTTYTTSATAPPLFEGVMTLYQSQTNAQNAVAAIYLNYRIFDTIFEALMLLISVLAVVHLSKHQDHQTPPPKPSASAIEQSIVQRGFVYLVVPLVVMVGLYIVLNGHLSPGGGFQGGAALAAASICVYLVRPDKTIVFARYERLEKALFLLIAITALVFAASNLYVDFPQYNVAYMTAMNILIGAKVFLGLSIVFFRFVHYEDT